MTDVTKGTMGTWNKRKIAKKHKGSQSTGKSKGLTTSSLERYLCRATRSWKHPAYDRVLGPEGYLDGGKRKSGK